MYMEEKDTRTPRDRAEGELLRHLSGGSGNAYGNGYLPRAVPSCGCRGGDRRGMPRNENAASGNGNNLCGGCGNSDAQEEIGNTYPCGENGVHERSLAMVYAPIQHWRGIYDPGMALSRGTQFRELDMPFYGKHEPGKGGNCRG